MISVREERENGKGEEVNRMSYLKGFMKIVSEENKIKEIKK